MTGNPTKRTGPRASTRNRNPRTRAKHRQKPARKPDREREHRKTTASRQRSSQGRTPRSGRAEEQHSTSRSGGNHRRRARRKPRRERHRQRATGQPSHRPAVGRVSSHGERGGAAPSPGEAGSGTEGREAMHGAGRQPRAQHRRIGPGRAADRQRPARRKHGAADRADQGEARGRQSPRASDGDNLNHVTHTTHGKAKAPPARQPPAAARSPKTSARRGRHQEPHAAPRAEAARTPARTTAATAAQARQERRAAGPKCGRKNPRPLQHRPRTPTDCSECATCAQRDAPRARDQRATGQPALNPQPGRRTGTRPGSLEASGE